MDMINLEKNWMMRSGVNQSQEVYDAFGCVNIEPKRDSVLWAEIRFTPDHRSF